MSVVPRTAARHLSHDELLAGLDHVAAAPRDRGTVLLVVSRPAEDAREFLTEGRLDPAVGLVGDAWQDEARAMDPGDTRVVERQLTVINSRYAELVAGPDPADQALTGDQLHVDLDITAANLPVGSRLVFGEPGTGGATIEVTAEPHTGCSKFAARFGRDAHKLGWSEQGLALRLRGLYARVVVPGRVAPGDPVTVERA